MNKVYISIILLGYLLGANIKSAYDVKGMMCNYGCVMTINSTISKLDGVKKCDVSYEDSKIIVEFDDTKIDSKKISESLPNPYVATLTQQTIEKKYLVDGMTCMGCVGTINSVLSKEKSIIDYSVSLENKLMNLEVDLNSFDEKKFLKTLPEKFLVTQFVEEYIEKDDK